MKTNSTFMSIKHVKCKNCERTFKDEYNFCPYCGQDDKQKLTLGVLFYNTINNYFSVDARFFKSFLPLMLKPGYLALRFIEGKRLLYLHPAQMYLFISIVFFFLFSFVSNNQVESIDEAFKEDIKTEKPLDTLALNELTNELQKNLDYEKRANDKKELNNNFMTFDFEGNKIDSLIKINAADPIILKQMGMPEDAGYFKRKFYIQALKLYKQRNGGSILNEFYDNIPIAMFFLLPIFALILKLLYYKKGSFSHHLVFSFYFFAFLFIVFSTLIFVELIFGIPFWLALLISLSTFFYLLLSVKRFYNESYLASFIKSNIAAIAFLLIVAPITAGIMFAFAFLAY
jgi:Protein of unknown function (DUF3667)